jgi:hypothetical protein
MDEKRMVIYTAGSVRDADLLKMRLARAGIDAAVVQGPAEAGAADAPAGWQSARQVVVAERDAEPACQIVRQFDEEHPGAGRIEGAGGTALGEPPGDDLQEPVEVYAAASAQDANFLKNLLAEAGIKATVTNAVLQGGMGGTVIGWHALARVVVAREDAEVAREIAVEFERRIAAASLRRLEGAAGDAAGVEEIPWPRCPKCDAMRTTKCPICETAGTDFARADPEFLDTPGPEGPSKPMSCGCGPGGCSGGAAAPGEELTAGDGSEGCVPAEASPEADRPGLMLMCPTCDEPFVPEYPRRCEWCGHEFDDGYEVDRPPELEHINIRMIAVLVALLALLIGATVYFLMIL